MYIFIAKKKNPIDVAPELCGNPLETMGHGPEQTTTEKKMNGITWSHKVKCILLLTSYIFFIHSFSWKWSFEVACMILLYDCVYSFSFFLVSLFKWQMEQDIVHHVKDSNDRSIHSSLYIGLFIDHAICL